MKWVDFSAYDGEVLTRGVLFRFPASYPFESVAEFMLFEAPSSDSGYGLICTSGYNSGRVEVLLPADARHVAENTHAISTAWLKKNWRKWVYPKTAIGRVKMCVAGRPKPRLPADRRGKAPRQSVS